MQQAAGRPADSRGGLLRRVAPAPLTEPLGFSRVCLQPTAGADKNSTGRRVRIGTSTHDGIDDVVFAVRQRAFTPRCRRVPGGRLPADEPVGEAWPVDRRLRRQELRPRQTQPAAQVFRSCASASAPRHAASPPPIAMSAAQRSEPYHRTCSRGDSVVATSANTIATTSPAITSALVDQNAESLMESNMTGPYRRGIGRGEHDAGARAGCVD